MNKLISAFIFINLGLVIGYLGQPYISEMVDSTGLFDSMEDSAMQSDSGEPKIKYWVAPMDANYQRDKPGKSPMGMDLVPVYEEQTSEPKIKYWVAPMDANYRRDKPGKSPMGMDLVPVYEEEGGEQDGVVKISPVVQNNLGVRISKVEKGLLDRPITTVGYIDFDEEKLFHIHTRVDGWVERLTVKASGDRIKKGQKLFELYSPDLVNAQEEYITALRSKNTLLINASKSRLRTLGIGESQINQLNKTRKIRQRIDHFSKHDGFINELNIRQGMYIKPAMEVMSTGQIDTIWVIAEVFERQSSWIKTGQTVDMTVNAVPGRSWQGEVDYIYPVLDPKTRTLRVRIRFDNPDEMLKPNMYAQLTIQANSDVELFRVPREAIIRNGQMERVVKALGDGKFLSVAVKTGNENNEMIEIIEGLEMGDKIVTSAQFLIDSESSLSASFERMQEPEMMMEKKEMSKSMDDTQAWVKGKINTVDIAASKMNIQHEPVDAWGWPQMMMDFPVSKSLDISSVNQGENFKFLVQKHDNGSIEIIEMNKEQ